MLGKLSGFCQHMGFKGSNYDASMMLYDLDGNTFSLYMWIIYVDDILVTDNNPALI